METCTRLGQIIIILLNTIFLLLGIALLVCGLMARFASETLHPLINVAEEILNKMVNSGTELKLDLTELLTNVAIILIVLGVVFSVLGFLGCCGACCQTKTILLIYAVILVIILIAEAVVVGLFFGAPEKLKNPIKTELKAGLTEYEGMSGRKIISLGWNIIMIKFQCCGVDDYKDFQLAEDWNATFHGHTFDMPMACCKTNGTEVPSVRCANASSSDNNKDEGCVDKVWNELMENKAVTYGVSCGTLAFELILIGFTLKLFFENDNSVNPIS